MMKKRQLSQMLISGFVFLETAILVVIGITQGAGEGQVGDAMIGIGYFKPFTMDSNILAAISALIMVCCRIRSLRSGEENIPGWAACLQLMAAASLFLTFVITALFLAPMKVMFGESYFVMFRDDMFFFHLVNPVLTIGSFVFLTGGRRWRKRECFLGAVPTVLYSIVYLLMVVVFRKWADFYNFTFGGRYRLVPIVLLVVYAVISLLSLVLVCLHNRLAEKNGM